jgi:hypothetical protein
MESKPNGTSFDFGLRAPYQEMCARWLIMLVYALQRALALRWKSSIGDRPERMKPGSDPFTSV